MIQKLLEIDYDFEVLKWDWHDGTKPDTTVTVRAITELDAFAFFDHVQAIVGPLGGDVIAADLVSSPPPAVAVLQITADADLKPDELRRRLVPQYFHMVRDLERKVAAEREVHVDA